MKEKWDKRYSGDEFVYGEEANSLFMKHLDPKSKKRVLLPGEGEGRNALFAVKNGCYVHAFDQSEVGAGKAVNLVRSNGFSIEYQICSCEEFDAPNDYYDAIGLIFLHLPWPLREEFHFKMRKYLRQGGRIIAEFFSKKQIDLNSGGPKNLELLYSLEEIKEDFEGFDIILLEEKKIELNEGSLHKGLAWVIQLVAEKKCSPIEESSS